MLVMKVGGFGKIVVQLVAVAKIGVVVVSTVTQNSHFQAGD
jgi:hypothetical protein